MYADWVDAADEVKKEQRRARKYGGGDAGAGTSAIAARGESPGAEARNLDDFIERDDDDADDDVDDLED